MGRVPPARRRQLIAAGHSVDLGLMQINSMNLGLLGLSVSDAFTACRSVEAAAKLLALFSRYNTGSPHRGIANGYATKVLARMDGARGVAPPNAPDPATTGLAADAAQPARILHHNAPEVRRQR